MAQVAFKLEQVAALAAVQATRPSSSVTPALPVRDLLVLHTSGQLLLYVGDLPVCRVRAEPGSSSARPDAYARLSGEGVQK